MTTASQILIVGGMSLLFFGLLMGIPMLVARSKAPHPPRYLFATHLVPIIQGGVLLALTAAVEFSALSPTWNTIGASALLAGMVFFVLGLAVNWRQGVADAFAENAPGGKISGIGLPLVLGGAGILFFGVLAGIPGA